MDTLSLFQQFYHDVKNQELSNLAKNVVQELLEKAGERVKIIKLTMNAFMAYKNLTVVDFEICKIMACI